MIINSYASKARVLSAITFILTCIAVFIIGLNIRDDWGYISNYSIALWIVTPLFAYFNSVLVSMFAEMADDVANIRMSLSTTEKLLADIRQNLNEEKDPEPKTSAPFTKEVPAGAPTGEKFM